MARITSLKDSVPAIRHHHERWDGLGYPDRLSGKDVPVEAAIIAIADAWDAMTTDRPYAVALDVDEAMLQIHAGAESSSTPRSSTRSCRSYDVARPRSPARGGGSATGEAD